MSYASDLIGAGLQVDGLVCVDEALVHDLVNGVFEPVFINAGDEPTVLPGKWCVGRHTPSRATAGNVVVSLFRTDVPRERRQVSLAAILTEDQAASVPIGAEYTGLQVKRSYASGNAQIGPDLSTKTEDGKDLLLGVHLTWWTMLADFASVTLRADCRTGFAAKTAAMIGALKQ